MPDSVLPDDRLRRLPNGSRRHSMQIRMHPDLRAAMLEQAKANARPLSAEIECRLAASLKFPAPTLEDVRQIIRDELRATLAADREAQQEEYRAKVAEALGAPASYSPDRLRRYEFARHLETATHD